MVRKGAFTSMVLVELIWLGMLNIALGDFAGLINRCSGILWVLWLAQAGLSASADAIFVVGCPYSATLDRKLVPSPEIVFLRESLAVNAEACKEFAVIEAFSFLNWIARKFKSIFSRISVTFHSLWLLDRHTCSIAHRGQPRQRCVQIFGCRSTFLAAKSYGACIQP